MKGVRLRAAGRARKAAATRRGRTRRGAGRGGARPAHYSHRRRLTLLFGLLSLAALALVGRAVDLQLVDHGFLTQQGNERFSRVATIVAHRGNITDRNGEPLAVSTPVDSVWVDPSMLADNLSELPYLAHALGLNRTELRRRVLGNQSRQFLYVARGLVPEEAQRVSALALPGVNLAREYRRYYPAGEVTGHVLGFTSVDDVGQEGMELAFDNWLAGEDGAKRVIQDSTGQTVEDVEGIRAVRPGRDLALSLDLRIQYLAYRELKSAVQENRASAGSLVMIDVDTGEVLAMVNQPAYNPNDRDQLAPAAYRNRAVTDLFEPGSSIKPFIVAAALASGKFDAHSLIDTNPGFIQVGARTFQDDHNLGVINLATILAKSSNVGMAKLALQLPPREIWSTLSRFGFGRLTDSALPGESAGVFTDYSHWRAISIATLSHGYGISVTALQLAQAYATIGALGVRRPVSMLRVDTPPAGQRVLSTQLCQGLIQLLEAVTTQEGATGVRARIPGYRVAGKTGTAERLVDGSYSTTQYTSIFAGLAPASAPRLATVVVIDDPGAGKHQGGDVAAPVFSAVVGGALRLLGVAPDDRSVPTDPLLQGQRVARR
ncbi:MAG TPA: penicillin-binding transpeptidase domain-containing protein [Steroidobacteraceae bacterium]|jgi:cell division protein FtsI (penicillin-binding protein 3)|nr:penicillin-binding transpeptidase domain-containing protein [Steroidobacteraceae bacterium]